MRMEIGLVVMFVLCVVGICRAFFWAWKFASQMKNGRRQLLVATIIAVGSAILTIGSLSHWPRSLLLADAIMTLIAVLILGEMLLRHTWSLVALSPKA